MTLERGFRSDADEMAPNQVPPLILVFTVDQDADRQEEIPA